MGLELYSFRTAAEKNFPGTLAQVRGFGIVELEVSGLYGHTAAEFRRLLDQHGLKATSMMADFKNLLDDCDQVAADAHQLGAEYVVCGTIPHEARYLSPADCERAAPRLNLWGERLLKAGLHFCYHTHGTEFRPYQNGTVFDVLAKRMDARYANFEMDVFWIVYAFQDPAALLRLYPGRFPLMHVKDIRKGTPLGGSPADVREEDSVPLGQGVVDLKQALLTAQQTGVRHFYIEDEAVDAAAQLPQSLRYLKSLRL